MAKHKFLIAYRDNNGKLVGAECSRCKKIAFHVDGRVPQDILAEECTGEDAAKPLNMKSGALNPNRRR